MFNARPLKSLYVLNYGDATAQDQLASFIYPELYTMKASVGGRMTVLLRRIDEMARRLMRQLRRTARIVVGQSVIREKFRRYLTDHYGTSTVENVRDALTITSQFGSETITLPQLHAFPLLKDAVERLHEIAHRVGKPSRVDVSIIVPAYNNVAYTLTCLLSVLRQKTRYSFEVIVGDDASSDATIAFPPATNAQQTLSRTVAPWRSRACTSAASRSEGAESPSG